MSSKKPRPGVRGNDLFREITLPGATEPFRVTYWDLWFVVVLLNEFEGNWKEFLNYFRIEIMMHAARGRISELMLNHLKHLHERVTTAGLSASQLLGEARDELLEVEQPRAAKKLQQEPSRRQMSHWMKHTPRVTRRKRAMKGYWDRFKPSPVPHARALKRLFKKKDHEWYTREETHQLWIDLSDFLDERLAKASVGRKVAVYRAFLTVVVDRIPQLDDYFDDIPGLCEQIFKEYVTLPRADLTQSVSLTDFFQDLIEWLIWENQEITRDQHPYFFAHLSADEASLVEQILRSQAKELLMLDLFSHFYRALDLTSLLYSEQKQFDKFVKFAGRIGTRRPEPLLRMVRTAEQHQRPDLALAVYEAAFKLGPDNEYLRKKYEELKARVEGA